MPSGDAMNRRKVARRLEWAVDLLNVQPADRLLEIGCGHGVAVSLVCARLRAGSNATSGSGDSARAGGGITAIDRSAKMIEMARGRNAACVAAGLASFHTVSLAQADFGDARFDKIFAIHVGVFLRGRPVREFGVIRRHFAPGGRLYLVYQPLLADHASATVLALTRVLGDNGFAVSDALVQDLSATERVTCVIAH